MGVGGWCLARCGLGLTVYLFDFIAGLVAGLAWVGCLYDCLVYDVIAH